MKNLDLSDSLLPPGMLERIIFEKQEIIAYYEVLLSMAYGDDCANMIHSIISDEKLHFVMFSNLYRDLFDSEPVIPQSIIPQIPSYSDGVQKAVLHELSLYNVYGGVFFSDPNRHVKDTFFRVIFDENAHSTKFNYLLMQYFGSIL